MSRRAVQNRQKPNKVARRATLFTTIRSAEISRSGTTVQAGNHRDSENRGLRLNSCIKYRVTLTKQLTKTF